MWLLLIVPTAEVGAGQPVVHWIYDLLIWPSLNQRSVSVRFQSSVSHDSTPIQRQRATEPEFCPAVSSNGWPGMPGLVMNLLTWVANERMESVPGRSEDQSLNGVT